jgi:hypothetical protein
MQEKEKKSEVRVGEKEKERRIAGYPEAEGDRS